MPPGALGAGLGPQPLGVYPHRTTHWSGRATMGIMWPTWAGLVWPAAHRERSASRAKAEIEWPKATGKKKRQSLHNLRYPNDSKKY